jgi:hypothetical protein
MKFDRALLEVVAIYLMEKFEEINSEGYPATNPADWLTGFFRYTLNGDIQLFAEFIRQHHEGDYILNELRKGLVSPWIYYERRFVLTQVDLFLVKLNPEGSSF